MLSSPDGIHDWEDRGFAYDPRLSKQLFSNTDGTVVSWTKMERPNVIMENGHITHFTFAVTDVDKGQVTGGSNHGNKVIVIAFDGARFDAEMGVSVDGGVTDVDGGKGDASSPDVGARGGSGGSDAKGTESSGNGGTGGSATGGTTASSTAKDGNGGTTSTGGSGGFSSSSSSLTSGGNSGSAGSRSTSGGAGTSGSLSSGGRSSAGGSSSDASSSGGSASGGKSTGTSTGSGDKDSGCGCRLGSRGTRETGFTLLSALLLGILRLARRRRS